MRKFSLIVVVAALFSVVGCAAPASLNQSKSESVMRDRQGNIIGTEESRTTESGLDSANKATGVLSNTTGAIRDIQRIFR